METGVKRKLSKCNVCFGIGKLMKNLDVLRHTDQPRPKYGLVFSSGRNKRWDGSLRLFYWVAFYRRDVH